MTMVCISSRTVLHFLRCLALLQYLTGVSRCDAFLPVLCPPRLSRLESGSSFRWLLSFSPASSSSQKFCMTSPNARSFGAGSGDETAVTSRLLLCRHDTRNSNMSLQATRGPSKDDHSSTHYVHNRRDALQIFTTAIMAVPPLLAFETKQAQAITLSQPRPSSIFASNAIVRPCLEDIQMGKGEWLAMRDSKVANIRFENNIISPSFATYATRFLIHYDEGFRNWWSEMEVSYSLLSLQEQRSNLGKNFGGLARSIQLSLEYDILQKLHQDSETDISSQKALVELKIRQRFEILLEEFYNSYGRNGKDGSIERDDEEVRRQLGLLFSTLPPEHQPILGLQKINNKERWNGQGTATKNNHVTLPLTFTEDITMLLPSSYVSKYDPISNCYVIEPNIPFYEIGVDEEFGQTAIATVFGPLSTEPLKRPTPNLSPHIYALLGINGALACALTHSLVIPFDVVKTRLQTDPDRYSNIVEGTMSIARTEGVQGFTLGAEATIAGYFWYGLSVYPSYSFFKGYLSHSLLSSAYATAHADLIALVAGAMAAVIASIGLTPLEACRIRTVAEPEVYRDMGLAGTLKVVAEENETVGWKALYAGLPSLMVRQVIFGSVKFLAFERACEAFFATWPFLKDTMGSALAVTLISGALSGALSSVVSQPADSVLTYVAKNKRENDSGGIAVVLTMMEKEGVGSLFRGLGSRCIWASAIISGQFLLYDIFRTALGINSDDLSQVFEFAMNSSPNTMP